MYLCGIKHIILDALLKREIRDHEYIVIKDWVYFYEVLARFSVLHWVPRPETQAIIYEDPISNFIQSPSDQSSQVFNLKIAQMKP
jgi:hypothetical protein